MSKIKIKDLSRGEIDENIKEFMSVAFQLEKRDEVIDFFVGLFSLSETVMFGRRIAVAKMLINNKSYDQIINELGVGRDLISKTEKWLNYRDQKYKKILVRCMKSIKMDQLTMVNLEKHPIYKSILDILDLR